MIVRYNVLASVLSCEGFTSGRFCWEVEVVEVGEWWAVGVAWESANRNGAILLQPEGEIWAIQRINGQYEAITQPRTNLSFCHLPSRIRVALDYLKGQVAFFDGNTNAKLLIFQRFFGEKLYAWFLIYEWNAQLIIHP